jgi:hypothetical protein
VGILKETLSLLIRADVDGAVQGFRKVGDAAERDLGKAQTDAERTSAKLTKMGAASLAAGGVAAAALMSTIQPASDLAEAMNVTGLTFGESADEMLDWSKSAAQAFGLSRDQALSSASAIGGLLNNVGFMGDESAALSQDLVKLSADMGSAFNMSTVDALEAIRSGLAGEAEPLKKFNVFLSEAAVNAKAMELGISDGTGALSEHEKAQARLAIIMEQTSAIQGDFANTADGAANASKVAAAQFRDAKAALGTELLPIVVEVMGAVNGLLGAFTSLPEPIQSVIGKAALATTGLLLVGGAALSVAGRLVAMKAAAVGAAGSMTTLQRNAAGAAAALGAAFIAKQQFDAAMEERGSVREAYNAGLSDSASEIENVTAALESLALSDSRVADGLAEVEGGARAVAATLLESGDAGEAFIDAMVASGVEYQDALNAWFRVNKAFEASLDDVEEAAEGSGSGLYRSAESFRTIGQHAHTAVGAVSSFSDRMSIMTEPVRTFEEQMQDAADAMDRFFGSVLSGERIEANFQQALDDTAAAIEAHGASFDLSTEAGRANLAIQEDVVQSLHDTAAAMVDQRQPADDIRARLQGMVTDYGATMLAAGASKGEVDLLIAALLGIPDQVATELENTGYDESIAELTMIMSYLDRIAGQHNAQVFITPSYSSPQGGGTQSDPDFELAPLDGKSGVDRSALNKSGRSGGGDIVIENVTMLDGREIVRAVERVSQRDGGAKILIRAGN